MARITYGALVENIRGSIGGTTFQNNKYGYTVKHKPNMTKPWTSLQKLQQVFFAQAVRAWRELAQTGRDNWVTWASVNPQYAKHNPSAQLSGFAAFVKYHSFNFMGEFAVIPDPSLSIPSLPTLTIKLILSGGVLTWDQVCSDQLENWNVFCFLSRPFGISQNFIGTRTRYFFVTSTLTDTTIITASYIAKFGALPIVSDRIAVDVVFAMAAGGFVNARQQLIIPVTAT